jgi:hypothetical protein
MRQAKHARFAFLHENRLRFDNLWKVRQAVLASQCFDLAILLTDFAFLCSGFRLVSQKHASVSLDNEEDDRGDDEEVDDGLEKVTPVPCDGASIGGGFWCGVGVTGTCSASGIITTLYDKESVCQVFRDGETDDGS